MKKRLGKVRKFLFYFSMVLFVLSLAAIGFYLFVIHSEDAKFKDIKAKIKGEDAQEEGKDGLDYYLIDGVVVQEKFKDLYIENSDTIGWVSIKDTPIDYPVMCTPKDEQFYIHKGFDKEYSFGGCIFTNADADIVSPSENIIMYGHHMVSQTMFKPLDGYKDEDFYKKHKYITFDSLRQTGTYEVIAAFSTNIVYYEEDGFMYYSYTNMGKSDFEEYVKKSKELTSYPISATAEYGDQLITLSTCAYHTYNGRFVVVAKRVDGKEVDLDKEPIEVIETKGEKDNEED